MRTERKYRWECPACGSYKICYSYNIYMFDHWVAYCIGISMLHDEELFLPKKYITKWYKRMNSLKDYDDIKEQIHTPLKCFGGVIVENKND